MSAETMTIELRFPRRVSAALAVLTALARIWSVLRLPVSETFLDLGAKRFGAWAADQVMIVPGTRKAR